MTWHETKKKSEIITSLSKNSVGWYKDSNNLVIIITKPTLIGHQECKQGGQKRIKSEMTWHFIQISLYNQKQTYTKN